MRSFGSGLLRILTFVCAMMCGASADAQARTSGSVNGINYTVLGGGSQNIAAFGDGFEAVVDGVTVRAMPGKISVDDTNYDVGPYTDVLIDQSQGGLSISVDGRDVVTVGADVSLSQRADAGDLDAMNELSILLFEGDGVPVDLVRAEQLLRAAADGGDPNAQSNLANRLAFGIGLAEDQVEAFEWAVRAADQEQPYGQYTAGRMLIYGIGTPIDADRAITYLEASIAQGNGEAATELGYIFGNGVEVVLNHALAADHYRMGISLGDARSAFNLAALALETGGSAVSVDDGLAAIDDANALGWDGNTADLRARLVSLGENPDARFFYADGSTPVGPMTLEQLRSLLVDGTLSPQTLVWEGGTENWIAMSELGALNE